MRSKVFEKEKSCILCNKRTDWEYFRLQVKETLNSTISLKTENEITEAIEHFNQCIQQAAWNATPLNSAKDNVIESSISVRIKVAEKRKLRKQWQITRSPELRAKLNKVIKSLRKMLNSERNQGIKEQTYKA